MKKSLQDAAETRQVAVSQRKSYAACHAALDILADLATLHERNRPQSSNLVFVGQFIHQNVRVTAHLLGPKCIHGGVLLITSGTKGRALRHEAYFLDDIQSDPRLTACREDSTGFAELVRKAVARRNRMLVGTTNYFSGTTGRVVKIL